MVHTQKILLTKKFEGVPKEDDFTLVQEELPDLEEGEFRVETEFWSVDPYLRLIVQRGLVPLNSVMAGRQIARVVESKNKNYSVGDVIFSNLGWQTLSNVKEGQVTELEKLSNFKDLPYSLGLGVLGRPGHSAYFGFLELCDPKPGETVVISAAAGAVGSHVGQIAKIKGCRVIGIAGSDEKVRWLIDELNFDHAFDYKTDDIASCLKKSAPNGVDCYFDNVGGRISSIVLSQMNLYGRVSVCGAISCYNENQDNMPLAPMVQRYMINNQIRMEGFHVMRWIPRYQESVEQNSTWIKEGKLKYRETITQGFENLPKTFIGLFDGENIGKAIVKK